MRLSSLALSAFLLCFATNVFAQEAETRPMSSEERKDFEARYDEGVKYLAASKFIEARKVFQDLWKKRRTYDIATQLAQAEMGMNLYRDAAEHFSFAIASFTPSVRSEPRNIVERRLKSAKEKIVTVKLELDPKDAGLQVDGRSVELIDGLVFVNPGTTEIEASKNGFRAGKVSVSGKAGEEVGAQLKLEAMPDSALPNGAGRPSSNGQTSGNPTSNNGSTLPPDNHGVKPRTIAIIGGAALTAVSAGIAIGFYVKGKNASSDADDLKAEAIDQFGESPCASGKGAGTTVCENLADKQEQRASANRVATIGGVATLVFGLATVGALVFWPEEKQTSRTAARTIAATPWIGTRGAGLSVVGSF